MRETITEKAVTAINELNKSALVLARQMKSGELNKPVAAATGISQLEFAGRTRNG